MDVRVGGWMGLELAGVNRVQGGLPLPESGVIMHSCVVCGPPGAHARPCEHHY